MPVFESFAKFFANLSPRSQRGQGHRSTVQPQTPPRYQLGHNNFAPKDDYLPEATSAESAGGTGHLEAAHSYVDNLSSPPGPPITSQRAPSQFAQPVIIPGDRSDMNTSRQAAAMQLTKPTARRTTQPTQMVKNQSRMRQDEARLLGGHTKDPKAVKIMPGATMQPRTKPGAGHAFSPTDRITSTSRTPGPVRAQARPRDQASDKRRSPTRPEDLFEETSRPSKKQRKGDGSGIRLTATGDDKADRSHQRNMGNSSQNPNTRQKPKSSVSQSVNAYEEVENDISTYLSRRRTHTKQPMLVDSSDDQFTESAAQQRREMLRHSDLQGSKTNGRHKGINRPSMDRVEIPEKNSHRNPTRHQDKDRESPDAIQGDTTTHPGKSSTDNTKTSHLSKSDKQPQPITRKRSSSDIEPTEFSSPSQGNKKAKCSGQEFIKKPMKASYCRLGEWTRQCSDGDFVPIFVAQNAFEIRAKSLGRNPSLKISFNKIKTLFHSPGITQKKVRMVVSGPDDGSEQIFNLEFPNKEAGQNMTLILRALGPHNVPFETMDTSGNTAAKPRERVKDRLRLGDGELSNAKGPRNERVGAPEKTPSKTQSASPDQTRGNHRPPRNDAATGVEISVEPLESLGRGPRSRTLREVPRAYHRAMNGCELFKKDQTSALLENDGFRDNWKEPLVYPPNGKKKAEVNLEDRDRLREDTYLNDNLIAFYMRFLQDNLERTNPDAAKRVYFFNSYFFATLRPQGTSVLNYKGVEKWTRSVDLFAYDYILVPINENQHWYVAIICNLPCLSLESTESAEPAEPAQTPSPTEEAETPHPADVHRIDETPEPESERKAESSTKLAQSNHAERSLELSKENKSQRRPSSSSTEDQAPAAKDPKISERDAQSFSSCADSDADDKLTSAPNLSKVAAQQLAQDETAASQPTKPDGKKKRSGPKLSPNQPTIITFDSLDVSRSPTIKVLREYISAEAQSKRGLQINSNDIKGMRCREIPLQPNFSDCGLYLLTYLEKFTQSPDWFIAKVLQRGMDSNNDWPPLGSGLLRYRLRTFLDDLYKEQNLTSRKSNQPTMADRSPITFLLGPSLSRQKNVTTDETGPQSCQEHQREPDAPSTPGKKSTPMERVARKTTEDRDPDTVDDQAHTVSMGTPRASKSKNTESQNTGSKHTGSKNTAAGRPRNGHTPTKKQPIVQVPSSQEKPDLLQRHLPAEARRKQRQRDY
ncbi:unnamed protein product [Penicillium olsonii]|nr:unnamed protein product [Penicillium olsonii]